MNVYDAYTAFSKAYLLCWVTWLFYIAITHLSMVWRNLHWFAKANAIPAAIIGIALDVAVNMIVGTVMFIDPPREWMFTTRLKRMKKSGSPWRRRIAYWICEHALNQFQRNHC